MSIARELAEENMKNFEEREKEARLERKRSVNWDLVRERCNPNQIKAIELFVEYRLYEGAASIAEMTILDFVIMLRELGIARG